MAAACDWSVIGISGNPFPGDSDQLERAASKYSAVAQSVLESAASLRGAVETSANLSVAVAEFTRLAIEVATTMDAVHERYQCVAEQLANYKPAVADAQSHAESLYVGVTTALNEQQRQRDAAIYLDQQLASGAEPPESLAALERASATAHARLCEIEATLAYYRSQVLEHSDRLDAAAATAAGVIEAIVAYSDLNDGFGDVVWDGMVVVSEWVLEHAEAISMVLDIVSFLLTMVAFVVLFTGIGAPIAAALFGIARACNVISRVMLAVKIAATAVLVIEGKRPLSDLALIGVDAALGKVMDKGASALAGNVAPQLLDAIDPQLLMLDDIAKHMDDPAIDLVLKHLPQDAVPDIHLVADAGLERFVAGVLVEGAIETAARFDVSHIVGTVVINPVVAPTVHNAVESAMETA